MGAIADAQSASRDLAIEYYDHLGIDPVTDVLAKNPDEIRERLIDTPSLEDDLKHLADCMHLCMLASRSLGQGSGFAAIHAMKFCLMAAAWRSAAQMGQDVVDEFLDRGDVGGARQVIENHILPLLRTVPLVNLLVSVRAQYAVVMAWSGDVGAARAEMAALQPYKASRIQRLEFENQRALIEQIAANFE